MAETRAYLRALLQSESDLSKILERTNLFLLEDTHANRFVTLFLAQLDPLARTLTYVSAGHQTVRRQDKLPRHCIAGNRYEVTRVHSIKAIGIISSFGIKGSHTAKTIGIFLQAGVHGAH